MTQTERFLQFVRQRDEKTIQDLQVSIRIDGDALVVSERRIYRSAGIALRDAFWDEQGGAGRESLPIRERLSLTVARCTCRSCLCTQQRSAGPNR